MLFGSRFAVVLLSSLADFATEIHFDCLKIVYAASDAHLRGANSGANSSAARVNTPATPFAVPLAAPL